MRRPRLSQRTFRLARRLRTDEGGYALVYVSLSAAVILGMVGLALDGSRAMITHAEAQSAADAAALAAASQLDGQAGACGAAKAKAAAVTNQQRFAEGGRGDVAMVASRCLSTLPASDSAAIPAGGDASDVSSRYIHVTTQQLTHQNSFLAALTSQNTAVIQRTAVAGFRRSLCAAAPVLMACDTFEWTPGVAFDAWINDASRKGFISDCGPSANCVHDTLAAAHPQFCVVDDSLEPQPGNNTNKAADGINTRFGQGGKKDDQPSDTDVVDFRPYSNDISGGTGWDCQAYWAAHHPSNDLPKPAGCTSNTTSVTRYSVYQAERGEQKIPPAGQPPKNTPTTTEERRLLYLAIFDCAAPGAPPKAFVKGFMLGPAEPGPSKHIWVEPLGLATSQTEPTTIHEEVQLYR